MYPLIRPFLFAFPPEVAHRIALQAMRAWGRGAPLHGGGETIRVMGLPFRNRVGLAAGFDKDAVAVRGLAGLGFGFIEVGTVTPRPQPGNPRPRLFRSTPDRAVINRMGFNSSGLDAMRGRLARLRERPLPAVLGVNVGINRDTPIARAADDYRRGIATLYPYADYLAVNLSSPNTPGLRSLQTAGTAGLLMKLNRERKALAEATGRRVPLVVKVSPDLDEAGLRAVAETLLQADMDGVIATNTTIARPAGLPPSFAGEAGGLSGAPLAPLAIAAVATLRDCLGPAFPIIGAGGICDPGIGRAMLDAGADLLQVYTGLIFEGPALIRALGQLAGGAANSSPPHRSHESPAPEAGGARPGRVRR